MPSYSQTEICQSDQNQHGCVSWTAQPPYSEEFTGAKGNVETWSGGTAVTGPACANNSQHTTYDDSWFRMSLMDTEDTEQPSFSYPKTTMAGWLCETTASDVMPNNSGAQGELFYLKFTTNSQTGGAYSLNGVTLCPNDPENVNGGSFNGGGAGSGFTAIWQDMAILSNRCQKLH